MTIQLVIPITCVHPICIMAIEHNRTSIAQNSNMTNIHSPYHNKNNITEYYLPSSILTASDHLNCSRTRPLPPGSPPPGSPQSAVPLPSLSPSSTPDSVPPSTVHLPLFPCSTNCPCPRLLSLASACPILLHPQRCTSRQCQPRPSLLLFHPLVFWHPCSLNPLPAALWPLYFWF